MLKLIGFSVPPHTVFQNKQQSQPCICCRELDISMQDVILPLFGCLRLPCRFLIRTMQESRRVFHICSKSVADEVRDFTRRNKLMLKFGVPTHVVKLTLSCEA